MSSHINDHSNCLFCSDRNMLYVYVVVYFDTFLLPSEKMCPSEQICPALYTYGTYSGGHIFRTADDVFWWKQNTQRKKLTFFFTYKK